MNDVFGGEFVAGGSFGGTGGAAVESATFFEEVWACSSMNCTVYSAATKKRGVGCVDDRVECQRGYVAAVEGEEGGEGVDRGRESRGARGGDGGAIVERGERWDAG